MSSYRPEIAKMLRTMPTGWRRQYNAGRRALASLGGPVLPDVPTPEQAVHLMMLAAGATRLDKGGDRPLGDYPVPQDVRDAAMVGLRMSYKMNYGADHFIGIARAIQLAIVDGVPPRTKDRMRNYFTRHRKDKQGRNFNNEERPSNGRIAWENWGGDAGFAWVARTNPEPDAPTGEEEDDPELAKYAYTVGRGVTSGAVIKTAVAKGGGVKGGAKIIGKKAAGVLGKSAAGKAIPIVGEALMVVDASRQGLRELGGAGKHVEEFKQTKGLFAKGKVIASRGGAALGRVAAATLIGPEGIEVVKSEMSKGAKANPSVARRFLLRDVPTIAYIDERLPQGSVVLVRDTPNWKSDKDNMVVQIRHGRSRFAPYTLCEPHEAHSTSGKSTVSHYGGLKDGHREAFLRQYMLPGETVNITLMRLHDEIQHRLLG